MAMKKFHFIRIVALVLAMMPLFISCQKDDNVEPEPKPESKCQMTFTTDKPIGSTIWLFVKKGNRPTEVIGAEAVFGINPFDGGPADDQEVVGLVLEQSTVTIKGDITYISFYDPKLTALDVSKNPVLETLMCDNNQLTSLDVSKNTALESLVCDNNQLTSLDVSKNTALKSLSCEANKMTSIDINHNAKLNVFSCAYNKISSLDISKNPELQFLDCRCNKIKAEEMSKIVNALPDWLSKKDEVKARFSVLDPYSKNEENEITEADEKIVKDKNWEIFNY